MTPHRLRDTKHLKAAKLHGTTRVSSVLMKRDPTRKISKDFEGWSIGDWHPAEMVGAAVCLY